MRFGITFDLKEHWKARGYADADIAEFDCPETVEAIDKALCALGHETERIGGLHELTSALAGGARWDMVFNIAEGMHGFGREAAVPALLDAWRIPYTFSEPLALCLTLHKAMAKRVVRDAGVRTPDFALVESPADVAKVDLGWPVFAKPVAEGTSKGVGGDSLARTPEDLERVCLKLLAAHDQPVLVESFLPGREFTVGLLGSGPEARSAGVMEVLVDGEADGGNYTYANKIDYLRTVRYELATDAEARAAADLALSAWRALGCRDGGRVDVRLDAEGRPSFIEANPLPGLHPVLSDLTILCGLAGTPHAELIAAIVHSACSRVPALTAGCAA
ncbi:D-alanine--D-alanine ligase family protein [Desulfocurvus sp. DL9XJH121]